MRISRELINSDSLKNISIILLCTTIVYLNTLNNGFVWDDTLFLVPNMGYRKLDLIYIFSTKVNLIEYLPFRDLSYALDYSIWGLNPFGFHLTNLLLYLISLVALHRAVSNIAAISGAANHEAIAFWTTLIFALHPLNAEVVNFIHGRNTLLAGLFLFGSFNLCLKGIKSGKNIFLVLSVAVFIAAVFSKAIVVFYPFFLAFVLFLLPEATLSTRKKLMVLTCFFLVDLVAVGVHVINAADTNVMDMNFIVFGNDNWGLKFAKALQIPFFYAKMFILPYPLHLLYHIPFLSQGVILRSLFAGTVIGSAIIVVWLLRKKYPLLYIATAWLLLSLGPVLNIFPTLPVVADRYAYLPILGFSLLCVCLVINLSVKRKVLLYSALMVLSAWIYIDFNRNMDWRSDITLWKSELPLDPEMEKTNLAVALWNDGQYDEALRYLEEDKEKLGSFRYDQYKGKYFMLLGDYRNAILSYQEALNMGGSVLKEIHVELGAVYEQAGMDKKACEAYLKALERNGQSPLNRDENKAREGLSRLWTKLMPESEQEHRQALQEPMNFKAQAVYAVSMYDLGFYVEAEKFYKRALVINPSSWETWYNLAITYMKWHRYDAAVKAFEKSALLNPKNKDALNNIGICYMAMSDYQKAIKNYEKALSVAPDFFYPAFNLGRVYFTIGNRELAVKYFGLAKQLSAGDPGIKARVEVYLKQLK